MPNVKPIQASSLSMDDVVFYNGRTCKVVEILDGGARIRVQRLKKNGSNDFETPLKWKWFEQSVFVDKVTT